MVFIHLISLSFNQSNKPNEIKKSQSWFFKSATEQTSNLYLSEYLKLFFLLLAFSMATFEKSYPTYSEKEYSSINSARSPDPQPSSIIFIFFGSWLIICLETFILALTL